MPQSPEYQAYIASEKWKAFATDAKVSTGGRCQGCDRETWNLQVHHLTYARLGNERASDVWVVCQACHLKFHPHHKKRVNKLRKRQGKSKIRGLLGVRPNKQDKPKRRKKGKRTKRPPPLTADQWQSIREAADKKLGKPKPNSNDFRRTLLA